MGKNANKKKLLRRGWFWVVISVTLLIIIVILSANHIIGRVIERGLISSGAGDASAGQVRFNPFAGSLTVDSLNVIQQDIDSLDIGNIHVRFRLLALFQRNIEIKEVIIRDLEIDFTVQSVEKNILGGLNLPTSTRINGTDSSSNWNFSLASVRIADSHIRLNYDDETINLGIEKVEISGLDSMTETGALGIDLNATINDSPFRTTFTIQSRNNETRLSGNAKIKALEIEPIAKLLPLETDSFSGTLHVDTDMEVMLNANGDFQLTENGSIRLNAINLKIDEMELETGEIKLQGGIDVNRSNEKSIELIYDGEAHISPIRLQLYEDNTDTGFTAMSWHGNARIKSNENNVETSVGGSLRIGGLYFDDDSVKSSFGIIHWKGDIFILSSSDSEMKPLINGNLSIVETVIEEIKPQQSLLHIQNLTVPNLLIDDLTDITVSGMTAAKLELFQSVDDSLFMVKKLWSGKLNIRDFNTFNVELIGFNNLSLHDEKVKLGISNAVIKNIHIEELKQIAVAKIQIDGVELETEETEENTLSCSIERIEANDTTLTDGKNLAVLVFTLQSVDLQAGPHHLYLNSTHVRNAKMQGTENITISLFDVNSLVLLESTDKRVLKDVQSSFPLSLSKALLMNIELKELKHLQLEAALISGLTTILRRSEDKPLSIGGMYSTPKDPTPEPEITFSIDRVAMLQNCTLIVIDETVEPRVRFDMKFKHLDVRGIGNKDKNDPLNFSSKIEIGSYEEIATEGFIQRNSSPPDLDISLLVNGFGLQQLSPYVKKHMGYRIDRGKLYLDGNLSIEEGQIDSKNTIILKNMVMIPEETEKSEKTLSIYAKPLERALKTLSDKNNTLTIDLPISGNVNDPDFDLRKVITSAVTKAIRTTIKLVLGIALWPYSGVYVAADIASNTQSTAELEPVHFDAGNSQLSDGMQRYLNQVARFLDEYPQIDMFLCSVGTSADQKRFSNKERLNRLSEKRAKAVKEYLVENAGIDPNRLFLCLPEIDSATDTPGYVELQI